MKVILLGYILFSLLILSKAGYGQAPNLGTVTGFALYTSNGAVTNSTTTTITGNIGTNLGAISGFDPPTTVNGIFYTEDDTTAQAAIDLLSAYNQLINTTTTMPGHAAAFGTETILAGVYSIGGAGSVGGDLTLDAAGNPNAVFIFKFNGAFTVGAASNIILINGALAGNIFWVADGAISIAANVSMKGTLISQGANSLGTSSSLEGRMLSTAGAIDVSFNTVTKPNTGGYVPVPIKLLSFTGSCANQNILLSWITETEYQNKYFTLERSENTADWEAISTINGAINSSERQSYSYLDILQTSANYYYRLKQTDLDGNFKYFPIIFIKNCGFQDNEKLKIYPNPSYNRKISLFYNGDRRKITLTQVYNQSGEKVFESNVFPSFIDFTNKVPSLYYVRVVTKDQIIIKKVILNK